MIFAEDENVRNSFVELLPKKFLFTKREILCRYNTSRRLWRHRSELQAIWATICDVRLLMIQLRVNKWDLLSDSGLKRKPNHDLYFSESWKIVPNLLQMCKKFCRLQKSDKPEFFSEDLPWYHGVGSIFTHLSAKKVKLNKTSIGSPIYGYGRPSKTLIFSKASENFIKFCKQKLISVFDSIRIYPNLIFAMSFIFI